jgi:hypothetical protein
MLFTVSKWLKNYDAKKCIFALVDPMDFLNLSLPLEPSSSREIKDLNKRMDSIKDRLVRGLPVDNPVLWINRGSVVGHEGRHRCKVCLELGIQQVPVVLRIDEVSYITYKASRRSSYDVDIILMRKIESRMGKSEFFSTLSIAQSKRLEMPPSFYRKDLDTITAILMREKPLFCKRTSFYQEKVNFIVSNFEDLFRIG